MLLSEATKSALSEAVREDRLLGTARALIDVPSPTTHAGKAADCLAEVLAADGFPVERVLADWPAAPAVVTRLTSGRAGRTLQFDGHLDTVHLPFAPSRVEGGVLMGSGASDMKGGIAALVEALRALRDTGVLTRGSALLTAHDHHEGPWGDKRQVRALIREGIVGDAVMLPEYLADRLPLSGRGLSIFSAAFEREGQPVHEVLRPEGLPDVVGAACAFVGRLRDLDASLGARPTGPERDTAFAGQIAGGEIYNQAPTSCRVAGTRRWARPGDGPCAVDGLRKVAEEVAAAYGTKLAFEATVQGDAFLVAETDAAVAAFRAAYSAVTGKRLPTGEKPFMDDGNLFSALAGIPAITHGPAATGAHTTDERVPVSELVRVARVYALTAAAYC